VDLHILFFIHVGTRRVIVSGVTANPDSAWVTQQARNAAMEMADLGLPARFLLRDHDAKFAGGFDAVFGAEGAEVKRVGPVAPNLNAYAERFAQTLRRECLDHFLILGEGHLRHIVGEFVEHYNGERPHQARGNVPLPGAGTDLPNWLEMSAAGTVMVDRKTGDRPNLFVKRAAASIAGGIQPGVLARALTPDFLDAGLAARLLMAMPPKLAKRWSEAEVAVGVEQAYHDALDKLLALDFDTRDGEQVPHVLALSPDGKAAWVGFYDGWAREQAAVEGELAAAFSKLEGYAAWFALLHHVISRVARGDDDLVPVGRESVEAGVALCRWFAAEARRVYATLSESGEERDARRIVEFIQGQGGRITLRAFQRSNNRKYPTSDHAEAALDALVQAGLARWVELPAKKKGRPIRAVELCVTHDTHDTVEDVGEDDDPGRHDDPHDTDPGTGPDPGPVSLAETGCDGVTPDPDDPVMRVARHAAVPDAGGPVGDEPGPRCGPGTVSGERVTPPAYLLVRDRAGLAAVAAALDGTALVGLDLETTGLDPGPTASACSPWPAIPSTAGRSPTWWTAPPWTRPRSGRSWPTRTWCCTTRPSTWGSWPGWASTRPGRCGTRCC
jgi:hypothetical protein